MDLTLPLSSPIDKTELTMVLFQYSPEILYKPQILYIDETWVSHCAYPVAEIAFTQGESRVFNVAKISSEKEISHGEDETNLGIGARRKGEFDASSKSHARDDDDNPISKLLPKRLRSRLKKMSGKPIAIPRDESPGRVQLSISVPVRVTRFTQKLLDKGLELLVAKTPRTAKGNFSLPIDPIILVRPKVKNGVSEFRGLVDEESDEEEIGNRSGPSDCLGVYTTSKKGELTELEGNTERIEDSLDARTRKILNFAKRRVIRGRVSTGFGGEEMRELLLILQVQGWTDLFLQGKTRKKMSREETRQFYINASGTLTSISSVVNGRAMVLMTDVISRIRGIPNLDQKLHGLGYGFWLGVLFESLGVPVQEWQEQTTKDVIGDLNQVVVPALKRGANGPLQRLRSHLADKEKEIEALRVSHTATIDEMHIFFKAKEAELIAENEKLKSELLQTSAALETARLTNSAHLKGIFEMLRTHHTSMAGPSSKQNP
ncbi:hypothetical protein KY289_017062 [Solanum tuberosum]|nr:hypothetical protein KY284_016863 [Solanum tuberosum]KAH0689704.1 hypothetical protein KY289_017062 [Solanum tuberosum]